jgi:hypothetical protein
MAESLKSNKKKQPTSTSKKKKKEIKKKTSSKEKIKKERSKTNKKEKLNSKLSKEDKAYIKTFLKEFYKIFFTLEKKTISFLLRQLQNIIIYMDKFILKPIRPDVSLMKQFKEFKASVEDKEVRNDSMYHFFTFLLFFGSVFMMTNYFAPDRNILPKGEDKNELAFNPLILNPFNFFELGYKNFGKIESRYFGSYQLPTIPYPIITLDKLTGKIDKVKNLTIGRILPTKISMEEISTFFKNLIGLLTKPEEFKSFLEPYIVFRNYQTDDIWTSITLLLKFSLRVFLQQRLLSIFIASISSVIAYIMGYEYYQVNKSLYSVLNMVYVGFLMMNILTGVAFAQFNIWSLTYLRIRFDAVIMLFVGFIIIAIIWSIFINPFQIFNFSFSKNNKQVVIVNKDNDKVKMNLGTKQQNRMIVYEPNKSKIPKNKQVKKAMSLFGLDQKDDMSRFKSVWKRKIREVHSDKNRNDSKADQKTKEVINAKQILEKYYKGK